MKKRTGILLALLVFLTWTQSLATQVVGYYPYWAQYSKFLPKDIRWNLVTTVTYGHLYPDEAGDLVLCDSVDLPNFQELIRLGKENHKDILISIGGPGYEEAMAAIAESEELSQHMAEQALQLVENLGVQGIEIDWSGIGSEEQEAYSRLVNAMSSAFSQAASKPLISLSVQGTEEGMSAYSPEIFELVDYVMVNGMEQMNEEMETVRPNADGTIVRRLLEDYVNAGVAKEKIIAIVPFYGKTFAEAKGLGSSHNGIGSGNEGYVSYAALMKKFDGSEYSVTYDEETQSEVAVSSTETIVFNGIPSMQSIGKLVLSEGYGGVAAYDLSNDHPHPLVSLLVTLNQILRPDVKISAKK